MKKVIMVATSAWLLMLAVVLLQTARALFHAGMIGLGVFCGVCWLIVAGASGMLFGAARGTKS
jgi:ABC-type uncharacterized transport system permease subunit